MSLTRYAPQIIDSFRLVAVRPVASARLLVPGLILVAGGQLLVQIPGAAPMGLGLSALASAGMAFFWQRVLVPPDSMTPVQVALRFALWTLALTLLQGVELAPAILFGMLVQGMPDADIYTRTGVQLFQFLIGGLFLILPQLALGGWKDLAGTRLQGMVLAGGLAVGLGYIIVNLPFLVAGEIGTALFTDFAPQTAEPVRAAVTQAIHAVNVFVVAGYFALVWRVVKDASSPLAVAEPVRPRRTTRLTRVTKARR